MILSKVIARKFIFPLTSVTGINNLISNFSDKSGLILMYHGITKKNTSWFSPRHLWEKQFEDHLHYLKKQFDCVSLQELIESKKLGRKKKKVALTFDDGYLNNLTVALPLLEKYQIPVTFFISGECIERKSVSYLFPDLIQLLERNFESELDSAISEMHEIEIVQKKNRDYYTVAKKFNKEKREQLLSILRKKLNLDDCIQSIDSEIWQLMTEKDVRKLSESNIVTIGSHGFSHYLLGEISKDECRAELQDSKTRLETCIGKPVPFLAYPDGNYNETVIQLAKEAGYSHQFAVFSNPNCPVNQKDIISRHVVSSTTTTESCMFFIHRAFNKSGIL